MNSFKGFLPNVVKMFVSRIDQSRSITRQMKGTGLLMITTPRRGIVGSCVPFTV